MKKSLLVLLFLPTFFFQSCSKKSDPAPETTETRLKGNWTETSSKYVYYNTSGAQIFTETQALGNLSFDGGSALTVTYGTEVTKGTYSTSKDSAGEYLTLSDGTDARKYSILSISNTAMSLSIETANDYYFSGGAIHTAAKSVLTTTLVKK